MPTLIVVPAANANTYASLATAETLLSEELVARAAWDAAVQADKERALISAARQLDAAADWQGGVFESNQPLAFPRDYVEDGDGRFTSGPDVPAAIAQAQVLLAASLLERKAGGQVAGGVDGTAAIKRLQAGSVEIEYRDQGVNVGFIAGRNVPDEIWSRVADYGTRKDGTGAMTRLARG